MILIPNDLAPNRSRLVFTFAVAVFTVLGLLYFGVAGLVDPKSLAPGGDAEAAETFAGYMAVRNLVIAGAVVVLLALRTWRGLAMLLILNGLIQTGDTVLGAINHEVAATISPAIIAAAQFTAAALLLRGQKTRSDLGSGRAPGEAGAVGAAAADPHHEV